MSLTKICRLCLNNCKNGKSLYDERGERNLLYDIILDYFHPKILDLKKAKHLTAICTGCWQSIADFHSFQALIQVSQLKLILENDNVETLENIKTEEDSLSVKEDHNVLEEHADRLELTRFLGNQDQVHNNCDESIPMIMTEEETLQSLDISTYYNISEDIDHVRIAAETSFSKGTQKQTDIVAQWRPTFKSLTTAEILRRALEEQTMDIVSSPKDVSNIDQDTIVSKYHMNEEGIDGNEKTAEENIGGFSFLLPSLDLEAYANLEPEENSTRLPLLSISKESLKVDIRSLEEPAMDVEEININQETIVAIDQINEKSIRDQQKTVEQNIRIPSLSLPNLNVEASVNPRLKESSSRTPLSLISKESLELDDRVAPWLSNIKCVNVAEAGIRVLEYPISNTVSRSKFIEKSISDYRKIAEQHIRDLSLSVENSIPNRDAESHVSSDHKESYSRTPRPSIWKESRELDDRVPQWISNIKCVAEADSRTIEEPTTDKEDVNNNQQAIVAKFDFNENNIRDYRKIVEQDISIRSLSVENSLPNRDVKAYVYSELKENSSRKPLNAISEETPKLDNLVTQWLPNIPSIAAAEAGARTLEETTSANEETNIVKQNIGDLSLFAENSLPNFYIESRTPLPSISKTSLALDNLVAQWLPNINCVACSSSFSIYSRYRQHFRLEHPFTAFHLVCCNCKFGTKSKIKEHMLFHNDPDMFICQLCGKSFTSSYSLGCHKRAVHPEAETEKIRCHKCSTDFTTRGGLSFHYTRNHVALKRAKQVVQSDGTIVYACEDCDYSTKIYRCFQSHRWYVHSPRNSFVCHVCSKGFKKASLLHSHLAVHAGQIPFICKICTVGFRYRKLLQRHLQDEHPEEHRLPNKKKASSHDPQRDSKRLAQLYQCSLCPAKFTGISNLKFHVKNKHARVLKVSSKEFGEASTVLKSSNKEQTKPSLAENFAPNIPLDLETPSTSSQTEGNDKTKKPKRKPPNVGRFKCALCKLRFLTSEHLKQHLIDGHRGQGIRKCLYCTKTFTSAKSLYGHSKSEHGDRVKQFNKKPTAFYKCPVCSMYFINRSNFDLHCKITHSLEVKTVKSILD